MAAKDQKNIDEEKLRGEQKDCHMKMIRCYIASRHQNQYPFWSYIQCRAIKMEIKYYYVTVTEPGNEPTPNKGR